MTQQFIQWGIKARGVSSVSIDWQATQRRAAAELIPRVQMKLKAAAPVSTVKPDAGRFRDSIGYRIDSGRGRLLVSFVSTATYAKFVLYPTQGGQIITPQNTLALRFTDASGNYVFASSVVRGSTPGNNFNVRVKEQIKPMVLRTFKNSITTITTKN